MEVELQLNLHSQIRSYRYYDGMFDRGDAGFTGAAHFTPQEIEIEVYAGRSA